jgi:hypothetical protein
MDAVQLFVGHHDHGVLRVVRLSSVHRTDPLNFILIPVESLDWSLELSQQQQKDDPLNHQKKGGW